MATKIGNTDTVVMGAGKWYIAPHVSGELDIATVAVENNLLGYTQGGATTEYTPETYTIEDDMGFVRRTFQVKANATMKTGILTFDIKSIAAMMSVGQIEEDTESGVRILKLGSGKSELKEFCVVFVYEDDKTKKQIRIGMIATNTAPLTLAFTKDKETVVDVTFTASTNGVDNTILVIEQDI